MPEIVEVEKLRRVLAQAWTNRSIQAITLPYSYDNPQKFAKQGWGHFCKHVTHRPILRVDRFGKYLWIPLGESLIEKGIVSLQLHLGLTGWFMPGNDRAEAAVSVDPISFNFIHKIKAKNARALWHLSDGQGWNYHDPRTWGAWYAIESHNPKAKVGALLGPDWLKEQPAAMMALIVHTSYRTVKDVLTDQAVSSGLGNYLACEICWRAGIHPHLPYAKLSLEQKNELAVQAQALITQSMSTNDHSHWGVFKRKDLPCPTCKTPIEYVKDAGGSRGTYFCPKCQPPRP